MTTETAKPLRILRLRPLLEKTGYTKSTQQREERAGRFPKRIKIGPNASGWLEHEVDDWIASRVAASRQGTSA